MAIRLSGMVSGLDTDSIVKELVSAYSTKKEKIVKQQTKLEWKQDAWKEMNSKIYSFYSSFLSKMRFSSAYTTKKSTSSDESIATVTAASGAVIGTQELYVSSLAKSSYLTGATVKRTDGNSSKLSASSTLGSLGISDTTISIKVKSGEDEEVKDIRLTSDMKISDLTKELKDAGVSANFDTTNQRFYISATKSGADYNFDITASDEAGAKALKALGIYSVSDEQKNNYEQIAGWDADARTTEYKNKLILAANYNNVVSDITQRYENQYKDYQTLLNYQSELSELEKKIADDPSDTDLQTTYNNRISEYNSLASSYDGIDAYDPAKVSEQKSAIESKQKEIANKFSSIENNNGKITLGGIKEETLQQEYKNLSPVQQNVLAEVLGAKTDSEGNVQFGSLNQEIVGYVNELKAIDNAYKADIEDSKANYQVYNEMKELLETAGSNELTEEQKKQYDDLAKIVGMDSYKADEAADALSEITTLMGKIADKFDGINPDGNGGFNFTDKTVDVIGDAILDKTNKYKENTEAQINFAKDEIDKINNGTVEQSKTVKIEGQDAKIELNGVEYTSNTNSFNINGLTITAKKVSVIQDEDGNVVSKGDPVIIDTATDTEGIYNTIKTFLTQYNELINAMDAAYNADSASKYEPLTDDEKDAMSEKEVEKWEQKIKDSLLRRDSTLNSVSSAMKNVMRGSYTINGQNYSLSTFGIKTLGYFTSKANEKNAYHIDGDKEDSDVSENADKLMAAIAEDPDSVMEFFQKLSSDMYSTLTTKMKSTTLSSAYTVYNDKQMKTDYNNYTKQISKWEQRIANMEDKYYKQFAAMETALSKLQSSTASLTSLLGGGA